ncbi:MAG: DUF1080 domain-containing protein [Planctomycetaceae bacterium]|nr:DUF1080 domain-containing protein [Planctomycetaceae bacterium]
MTALLFHRPLIRAKVTFLLFAGMLGVVFAVDAQDHGDEKRPEPVKSIVLTSIPENDPEYALLGEFVGPISVGENKYEPLALQIRPIGGDNFEALQYRGGLPGQKTHKPAPIQLIGRRSGDFVILSGGPWAIFVEKDHCLIVDREGNHVGRLERVTRQSPTLGAQPPKDAIVLFDGTNTDQFTIAEMTPDGLLMQGADLKPMFQDFNLHVEFRLPYMPASTGQARGNSGLYLQSRYELQVLDSFAEEPTFNGIGSLYRTRQPDINMCLPPLQWQTYDVAFTAPRWAADGTKVRNAQITAWLNGVKVQDDVELANKTGAGQEEAPTLLPIRFQNHKDPVRFRNIWLIDRGLTPVAKFPVYPTAEVEKPNEPPTAPKSEANSNEAEAKRKITEQEAADKKKAAEKKKQVTDSKSEDKQPDLDLKQAKPPARFAVSA